MLYVATQSTSWNESGWGTAGGSGGGSQWARAAVKCCLTGLKGMLKAEDFLRKLGGWCKEDCTHCSFPWNVKISELGFWGHSLYYETYITEKSEKKNQRFDFIFNIMLCNAHHLRSYFPIETNTDKMLKFFSSSKAWFLWYINCNLSKIVNLWKV